MSSRVEKLMVLGFMDLKLKYQNSVLGFFWSFLKPLLQFFVYFSIFGLIAKFSREDHYALKLFYGILIWSWFSEGTSIGLNSMVSKKPVILKIKVNKFLFPSAAYLTSTLNHILNFLVFLVIYLIFARSMILHAFSITNFFVFFLSLFALSIVILSLATILANLYVLYRDMQHIWELVLNYGIFLTPVIFYLPIPKKYEVLYYSVNLVAFPLQNLKAVFFPDQVKLFLQPGILFGYTFSLSILVALAYYTFKKLNNKVADFL